MSQFLEEVYSATLPEFEVRKFLLAVPLSLIWQDNVSTLKLAQAAKCIPQFSIVIRCAESPGKGVMSYLFKMSVLKNELWEMWPEKAWNSLEAEGTLFPTSNPSFMSTHEIGANVLTWNC